MAKQRKVKTHVFNKVRYYIHIDEIEGLIDSPSRSDKRGYPAIRLPNGLPTGDSRRARLGLITLIHETLHASAWNETEKKVERTAAEIGKLLWRLGYRREEK